MLHQVYWYGYLSGNPFTAPLPRCNSSDRVDFRIECCCTYGQTKDVLSITAENVEATVCEGWRHNTDVGEWIVGTSPDSTHGQSSVFLSVGFSINLNCKRGPTNEKSNIQSHSSICPDCVAIPSQANKVLRLWRYTQAPMVPISSLRFTPQCPLMSRKHPSQEFEDINKTKSNGTRV